MESLPDNSGVKLFPPLIYLAGLSAGLVLQKVGRLTSIPRNLRRPLSVGFLAVGLGLIAPSFRAFRKASTNIDVREPSTTIVTAGPYRLTRNPIYLGLANVYVAASLRFDSVWSLILLPAVLYTVQHTVIESEERYLERKFGAEYLAYKASVNRWL
ncbi:MAG: isoprenylcysteine carboxylmethyltransferase family protein [Candidatus Eremiobacteraeota bacterium]|nr:isoprenylcysteine carboxylmethyltransferase family protein [Candidatus Eremiobacteraeota bacterium]